MNDSEYTLAWLTAAEAQDHTKLDELDKNTSNNWYVKAIVGNVDSFMQLDVFGLFLGQIKYCYINTLITVRNGDANASVVLEKRASPNGIAAAPISVQTKRIETAITKLLTSKSPTLLQSFLSTRTYYNYCVFCEATASFWIYERRPEILERRILSTSVTNKLYETLTHRGAALDFGAIAGVCPMCYTDYRCTKCGSFVTMSYNHTDIMNRMNDRRCTDCCSYSLSNVAHPVFKGIARSVLRKPFTFTLFS
jgi:DNA-directed RNA polymerase subunit RPC12/RpoP